MTTTLPPLTPEQAHVASDINNWYHNSTPDESMHIQFRLGGLAGTGKTTLISNLLNSGGLPSSAQVAAFTGKAASVLRSKGISHARTLHSLLYRPVPQPNGKVLFNKRDINDPEITSIPLLIVDEASMISKPLMDDILSFHIPVLWVGDHGQLPPVGDDPGLMHPSNLDARLETIHRQALDNPIIRYAHHIRTHGDPPDDPCPPHVNYCKISSIPWGTFPLSQVLVSTNAQRHTYNSVFRQALGYTNPLPVVGDRVICLRNNSDLGLFNGEIFTVTHATHSGKHSLLTLQDDAGNEHPDDIRVWQEGFGSSAPFPSHFSKDTCHFDYAYAITTHKSQGSQWRHVLVVETPCRAWARNRWLYTAITRAEETVTLATP